MQESRINVRIEKELKDDAENLFERLGLNMSTAIAVFLKKAVEEQAIPFIVGTHSSSYAGGLLSSDVTKLFQLSVQSEISDKIKNDVPIARYDKEKGRAFLEYADGRREYIENE